MNTKLYVRTTFGVLATAAAVTASSGAFAKNRYTPDQENTAIVDSRPIWDARILAPAVNGVSAVPQGYNAHNKYGR